MKKIYKDLLKIVLILLAVYIILQIKVVKEMLNILAISFIISYSLRPFHKKLVEKGVKRKLSAALLIIGVIAMFLITLSALIPNLIKDSTTINKTLTQLRDIIEGMYEGLRVLNDNKTVYMILSTIYDKINSAITIFFNAALDKIFKLGENLLTLAVIPIIVYYFLSDYEKISNKLLIFIPIENRKLVQRIREDLDKILGRYILSQLVLCLIIGVLTFIILIALKVEYPLLLALINSIFNIIPYFGPFFGSLPAVLMALLKSPQIAIWTSVALYLIQQIEGDVIAPKITGDSVSIHPLVVIVLLIMGGKVGGFLGMVLAVPVGVIVKVIYEDLNYYLF